MDFAKKFGTDQKKENEGVWVAYDDETSFLIARWGNPQHKKVLEQLTKPYRTQLRNGLPIPEKTANDIVLEGIAEGIILDWKGVFANEESLPYSKVSAKTLLAQYPDFQRFVSEISNNMYMFQRHEDEEAEKNSERSSSGS